jgi:hypothetical protein
MNPIRLRGTAEVVAALPYQLGYHLEDCVVVVALHGGSVGMLQRLDLPAPDQAREAADQLTAPLLREDPDAVLLVAYERGAGTATPVLDAAAEQIARTGIEVLQRVVVRGGRWYAPDCHGPCCPEEGLPLPEPADIPAVAEFVALEAAPLPSRGSLASMVAGDGPVCRDVAAALARPAGAGPARRLRVVARDGAADADPYRLAVERLSRLSLWARACDVSVSARPVDELSPAEVAELVRSLQDLPLRDGVIARLCPGTLPLEKLDEDLADALLTTIPEPAWAVRDAGGRAAALAARRLLARLQWLARAVPDEHCAPLLTLVASVSWWIGEGSVARVAVERALEHEPGYRLALLVEQLLDHGIRPGGAGSSPALSA